MKKIYRIAKIELLTMFYSPVAWLILIIFTIQLGLAFNDLLHELVLMQSHGNILGSLTPIFVGGSHGLLAVMQNYLYLYMPLLTMGLMSREYNSGTIKLLYSSPITATDIILGKFIGMVSYGMILIVILSAFAIGFSFTVDNFCYPELLCALLGLFLLLCAYSAIGLFVSSLTSYPVVAAIGTLLILAILNYMDNLWQEVDVIRDITYWFCLSGRTKDFSNGLLRSEDFVYFIVVIVMFLLLSILRLQSIRQSETYIKKIGKYVILVVTVIIVAYITSRPVCMYYYDTTATKRNTLTPNSQEIMNKIEGGLSITTYVNLLDKDRTWGLPRSRKEDEERFRQYLRFKPETKMEYVYYYAMANEDDFRQLRKYAEGTTLDDIVKQEAIDVECPADMICFYL